MKVVAVTPLYPPHSRVGAWLHTHTILRTLVQRGHIVQVKTTLSGRQYLHEGVGVEAVGSTVSQYLDDADFVIAHHGDTVSRSAEAAAAAGVPHVTIVHGDPSGRSCPDSDLVIFNSRSTRDAVDWDVESVVCRPKLNVSEHSSTRGLATTLVNMSEAKGGTVLRRIAKACPDRQFLGVEGGHGRQVSMSGLRNVQAVANTANMRRHVWSKTRVLLMPSEKETWGMVGVEAMCSGIPVIAHPTPGLRESLGDAGIFVDRNDIAGWVEALERLDDPHEYSVASVGAGERAAEVAAFTDVEDCVVELERRFG